MNEEQYIDYVIGDFMQWLDEMTATIGEMGEADLPFGEE